MANEMMNCGAILKDLAELFGVLEEEIFGEEEDDSPEKVLNDAIQCFGFEAPVTISIARMVERGDVSTKSLRLTLIGLM